MNKPLMIDLYAGLGGWAEGGLAEGYDVIGFDNERHQYGDAKYPAQLVLQDVLTLHGSQFKDAALIVASPPCQKYSYMAMPWSRAKQIEREYQDGTRDVKQLTALFDACFRIQREACEAAGRHIPLIVENVRGAQKWVGRSRFNYGSFHLWGDVPALMPITRAMKNGTGGSWFGLNPDGSPGALNNARDGIKNSGARRWNDFNDFGNVSPSWTTAGVKVASEEGRRTDIGNGARFTSRDCGVEGIKQSGISGLRNNGKGDRWFQDGAAKSGSKSNARKAASAAIAKIPMPLARYIAAHFKPKAIA
jgi:hypothetical protein